jgi:hypothetical protein
MTHYTMTLQRSLYIVGTCGTLYIGPTKPMGLFYDEHISPC